MDEGTIFIEGVGRADDIDAFIEEVEIGAEQVVNSEFEYGEVIGWEMEKGEKPDGTKMLGITFKRELADVEGMSEQGVARAFQGEVSPVCEMLLPSP